jgi:tetratricopeptide (TPR) repeat protein
MTLCPRAGWLAVLFVTLSWPAVLHAQNEGQEALDQATEAKLSADSMDDLADVIRLCRRALRSGLDVQNTKFATEMLAGTLTQRAEIVSGEIFDNPVPPVRWPELRRIALSDLEESVQLDAEQADAQFMLGRLNSLPGGDRKRAVSALDEAVRLTEKDPLQRAKALLIRANLASDEEHRVADYNEAVKLAPHNAEPVRSRGLYHLMREEFDKAVADLDKAIEIDPANSEAYDAKGVAQFLQKDYDEALKTLDKAVELAPNSPLAYTHRARIFAIQGDNDKALDEVEKAIQLEPRATDFLLLRARIHQQATQIDKALDDVNDALRIRPAMPEALRLHAELLAGTGKFHQAIDDLEELNSETPHNVLLLLQLGLFYSADKQPQKAIDTLDEVIEQDPKNWIAHRARADAYLGVGKQADALADYEAALRLQPEESGVLNNLAWLLATSPDDKLRNGKRSIELGTEACKLTHYKQAHILSTLAAGYAETGDFDSAIKWSEKAVAMGQGEMKAQLAKELASYQEKKPWRESEPPTLAIEPPSDGPADATQATATEPAEPADDDSAATDDR